MRARRARWLAMSAGTTAVLLAAAACGPGEAETPPTSSAPAAGVSAAPSPSPTVNLRRLPEQPEAMNEPTAEGAVAAATYVLQLYGYTFATRDVGPWHGITLDTCSFCSKVVEAVDDMNRSGDESSGSTITVESTRSVEISDDRWFSVDLEVTQGPSQRTDRAGNVIGSDPGGRYRAVFALSWAEDWRVDSMGFIELEPDQAVVDG